MIKVFFPQGCYGSFLTKCIYNLTSLNTSEPESFVFDEYGSSHDHRNNIASKQVIQCGHVETLDFDHSIDQIITLIPDINHHLDYYDNQFCKEQRAQLVEYIKTMFTNNEIEKKLSENWNYNDQFNDKVPSWILREWASFWIKECLDNSYNQQRYLSLPSKLTIDVNQLFSNLHSVLSAISESLSLKLIASPSLIAEIQNQFVKNQRLHNIQNKCKKWVESTLTGNTRVPSPCITIFDEAYVQYLLRNSGYEIQCQDLNQFPKSSSELEKIIYEASNSTHS